MPLGRGSTGRTIANSLTEQLAMEEILSNPSSGKKLENLESLSDPRWQGWSKMTNEGAHGIEIHYNARWVDGKIVEVDDFKFEK